MRMSGNCANSQFSRLRLHQDHRWGKVARHRPPARPIKEGPFNWAFGLALFAIFWLSLQSSISVCLVHGLQDSHTLCMAVERRKAALDQHSPVLQHGAHEAPCGRLAQEVHQELHKALAVQQHRGTDAHSLARILGHSLLEHLHQG